MESMRKRKMRNAPTEGNEKKNNNHTTFCVIGKTEDKRKKKNENE